MGPSVALLLLQATRATAGTVAFEDAFACSNEASFGIPAGRQGWAAVWTGDPWQTDIDLGTRGVAPRTDESLGSYGGSPDAFENFLVTGHGTWRDIRLEADLVATDSNAGGLIARYSGTHSYYVCWTTDGTMPSCAGSPVARPGTHLLRVDTVRDCLADDYLVASAPSRTYAEGRPARMAIEARGGRVTCELDADRDGTFEVSLEYVDPTPLSPGRAGVGSYASGQGLGKLYFDGVLVVTEDPDSDADGLPDAVELGVGTDRYLADSDGDGVRDRFEVGMPAFPYDTDLRFPIDALDLDSDEDGISDFIEGRRLNPPPNTDCEVGGAGADPYPDLRDLDSDGDFFFDGEDLCRLGPNTPTDDDQDGLAPACDPDDADVDFDDDGLRDGDEVDELGTDPRLADTDGGGVDDGTEVLVDDTDPLDPADDRVQDTDGDGIPDRLEGDLGTDPQMPDSDLDLLDDGREVYETLTDPTDADSDDDDLLDGEEVDVHLTDPWDVDTDDDALRDGEEVSLGTDPLATDTDLDGLGDGDEVACLDGDPLLADTDRDRVPDFAEVGDGDRDRCDTWRLDTDGDGHPDLADPDDDGDGIGTLAEDLDGDRSPANDDTDGDETPNYLDDDDDDDGVPTADEDLDGDGNWNDDDLDGDGIPSWLDPFEEDATRDADGDGLSDADERELGTDFLIDDSDSDGLPDGEEVGDPDAPADTDGDGLIDALDEDDDGDGLPTRDELDDDQPRDTDGDGVPDHLDRDSDDDGASDGVDPEPLFRGGDGADAAEQPGEPAHGFGLGCASAVGRDATWTASLAWLVILVRGGRRRGA